MGKDILHRVGNDGHCGCETVSREVLPQVEIPEKWTQEPPCFALTIWCAIKIAHQKYPVNDLWIVTWLLHSGYRAKWCIGHIWKLHVKACSLFSTRTLSELRRTYWLVNTLKQTFDQHAKHFFMDSSAVWKRRPESSKWSLTISSNRNTIPKILPELTPLVVEFYFR